MRHLPEEQDGEQHCGSAIELAGGGGPANHRWGRTGNRAHQRAEPRQTLQRRIDEHVEHEPRGAQRGRQKVDLQCQDRDAEHGERGTKKPCRSGPQASGRQRPIAGAAHQGVDLALVHLVERVSASNHQDGAEQREGQGKQRRARPWRQQEPGAGRGEHERAQAWLGECPIIGQSGTEVACCGGRRCRQAIAPETCRTSAGASDDRTARRCVRAVNTTRLQSSNAPPRTWAVVV